MLYPVVLFAMLVIVAIADPHNVRAESDQPGPELQAAEPQLLAPLFQVEPAKVQPVEVRATGSSLTEIARWLSANYDLPFTAEPPQIQKVTQLHLWRLRHRAFLSAQGGEQTTTTMPGYRDVVAVYDDTTRTIYLPESWTGATVAEQSVLVHEMVHHLQNVAGQKFACGGEREKPAYFAQDKWLKLNGLELEDEFEVDMFTVVARSACMG